MRTEGRNHPSTPHWATRVSGTKGNLPSCIQKAGIKTSPECSRLVRWAVPSPSPFSCRLSHPFHPKDLAFSLAGLRRGAHVEYTPAYAALLLLTSHSDSVHACLRSATLFSSLPTLAAEILPSQISSCLDATHRFSVLQHTRHFYLATFASSA